MESDSEASSEPDGYVQDGFVVPDEILEDHESDEERILKKDRRRRRLKKNDQEDLELLKENFRITEEPKKKPKIHESSSEESLEPGEIPGVYNENIQLAAAIFGTGNVSSTIEERKLNFEPAECREKFIRNEDEVIRDFDIPERLQFIFKGRENPSEKEIAWESE